MDANLDELSAAQALGLFEDWIRLDAASGYPSPRTIQSYVEAMAQFVSWMVSRELRFADLREEDVKIYRSTLMEHNAVGTVARKLVAIRRFFDMAEARGYVVRNPARRVRPPRDLTDKAERVKYLTRAELERVLSLPAECPDPRKAARDRLILSLMAIHGLRTMEVSGLNVSDHDPAAYDHGAIRVYGKGRKTRHAILVGKTAEMLGLWLQVRAGLECADSALVVTLHTGVRDGEDPHHRISRRSIRALVDGYLSKAGAKRPGVSCHSLRHSFATHALAEGARLVDISAALGHAELTTTMVYAKVLDRDKHNPARVLEQMLSGEAHVDAGPEEAGWL